jgi:hypothetical protein
VTIAYCLHCDRLTETFVRGGSAILSTSYFRPRCGTASLFALETYLSVGVFPSSLLNEETLQWTNFICTFISGVLNDLVG